MNSVLVIRGGAIGDFILTLPAIDALRAAYPKARLEILGNKPSIDLAENRSYAQRVRSLESPELARFFAPDSALPLEAAHYFAGFDLIISYLYDPELIFQSNLRRAGANRIICGPAKIKNGSHATRQLAHPIEELGLPISDFAPKLRPSNENRRRAEKLLEGLARPLVTFHPGSGSEKKNWPVENWVELGNHFLAPHRFG